ncbi:MAG: spore maturation protein [Firmicutes bacterium]|nr:spore maturation protein [Bacillota bacterium]
MSAPAHSAGLIAALSLAARYFLPLLVLAIVLLAAARRVPVFEEFSQGARRALPLVFRLVPPLVGMLAAVSALRASGAFDLLARLLDPLLKGVGFPAEVLPLALVRPFSGSAALGIATEIIHARGPDSFPGWLASILLGSTETTFYVLTVYFGSVGIRDFRHAPWVGLIGEMVGLAAGFTLARLLY